MLYGAEASWGYKTYQSVNNLHNRMMRAFLGVSKQAPCAGMSAEMLIMQPQSYIWLNLIGFWCRIRNMADSQRPKRVLLWDMSLSYENSPNHTYSNDIYTLLNNHGLLNYYFNSIKQKKS